MNERDRQLMQLSKEKSTNDKLQNTTHITKDRAP